MKKQPFLLIACYIVLSVGILNLIPAFLYTISKILGSYRSCPACSFSWHIYLEAIMQPLILLILLITFYFLIKESILHKKMLAVSLALSAFFFFWQRVLEYYVSAYVSKELFILAGGSESDFQSKVYPDMVLPNAIEIIMVSLVVCFLLFLIYKVLREKSIYGDAV